MAQANVYDFCSDAGAIPHVSSLAAAWHNGRAMNASLGRLHPGDALLVPNYTFHLMGGVIGSHLRSVMLRIEGSLVFWSDPTEWPRNSRASSEARRDVLDCLLLDQPYNLTITSAGVGTLDGRGDRWWGLPGLGYLARGENRPRLLTLQSPRDVTVEKLRLLNSPYWTFWAPDSNGLEVRHVHIEARRTTSDSHHLIDLTAFNTDGFDVQGSHVWIHDCSIWNNDDCVSVKDNSSNMIFERLQASGMGLTIGSLGNGVVRNITFRNSTMHHTFKGIYV
ncbi:MAG: hypothetical protein SGPRY_013879, partial [Prymnesium sp.]